MFVNSNGTDSQENYDFLSKLKGNRRQLGELGCLRNGEGEQLGIAWQTWISLLSWVVPTEEYKYIAKSVTVLPRLVELLRERGVHVLSFQTADSTLKEIET